MLCFVSLYLLPGFPSPTITFIFHSPWIISLPTQNGWEAYALPSFIHYTIEIKKLAVFED